MNEADIKPAAASAPTMEKAEDKFACLQQQIQTLMIALVVTSGVLLVFIWQQMRYAIRDRDALNQMIQPYIQEKAAIDQFLQRAMEFGKKNPDFMPVLNKYQVPQAMSNAAAATPRPTVTAPAPAPATAPKK
jgi:hypothetical protein